jgi:hypothetical protein
MPACAAAASGPLIGILASMTSPCQAVIVPVVPLVGGAVWHRCGGRRRTGRDACPVDP